MNYKEEDLDEIEIERRSAIHVLKQIVLNKKLVDKYVAQIKDSDSLVEIDRIRRDAITKYLQSYS